MALEHTAPDVAREFDKGHFLVRKSQNVFSAIAIDHAHEQNNKIVKGDGGAVGLTENASQLLRWMVSGPEMARLVNEFELSQEVTKTRQKDCPISKHHEQTKSIQNTFMTNVKSLLDVYTEFGNPFLETTTDLVVLDTRDIIDQRVAETISNVESIGKKQFDTFVSERLATSSTKSIYDPIKQNRLLLFSRQQPRSESKDKQQIRSLKQNCSLFSQLYVSCQVRNGDLEEFFRHENQPYPPSLSKFGDIRLGTKSDLLVPLERIKESETEAPNVDVVVLDGAAIVNLLKPRACRTFQGYSRQIFLPYVKRPLRFCSRVDVVWDQYFSNSLKASTRKKRGKGIRRRVQNDTMIPGNLESFLRVDENKKELFMYLLEELMNNNFGSDKVIVTTKGEEALSNKESHDISNLAPCSHEEADTRMMLHVADAARNGLKKVMIRTVDTDVVVLGISIIPRVNPEQLWIAFDTGNCFRYICAHGISSQLGSIKSKALVFFHAFTGCDQVSSFANRGKKTAWDTWGVFDQITEHFEALSMRPDLETMNDALPYLERFCVLLYDRTSECAGVNTARKDLFTRKGRPIENIPPTSAAFLQHVKRATYQAGYCWGLSLYPSPDVTDPFTWGWCKDTNGMLQPFWTQIGQASEACNELIKCGCKSEHGCRGRCKCVKASMLCTALCKCGGECDREC
ncbi:hypothetical protein FSP39_005667 [Pinctada imbricata]|uniref:Tesmin/TSO1-like CXC domain-containing protein n=1 Tax=Pinctada imbricata TaxID=66713 RepID=A0AA88XMM1_PINIB|nr:hypothetical protein FSP39_005667 [Pinctada imbricata]